MLHADFCWGKMAAIMSVGLSRRCAVGLIVLLAIASSQLGFEHFFMTMAIAMESNSLEAIPTGCFQKERGKRFRLIVRNAVIRHTRIVEI